MRKVTHILLITALLFVISSAFSFAKVCCQFSATRYYGWPYPYLALSKTTDSLLEAERVGQDSIIDLMDSGWIWSFSANPTVSLAGSATLSLLADIVTSLCGGLGIIGIYSLFKRD